MIHTTHTLRVRYGETDAMNFCEAENKPVRGSAARGAGLGGIGGPCVVPSARAPKYNGAEGGS